MSTIDEVLAAAEVVDAVCVIDGETRIISVPTEYKELGVESDEKVTRVKFQCPKIVGDNIDLTEYNLYINYRNAGNKLNSYLVEDVTVTGDTINFSWLLSRHVTESPGTISYILCAKKSDDTGVINEWNTKVATGIVGIGLEATEEIEEQNIDVIEQILKAIVDLENGSGGSSVTIDTTLSVPGRAADAKATGDAISQLSEEITAIPSGKDGVGIESVVQTATSAEDGGTNVVTVTKTDGTSSTFQVKNGSKGSTGSKGDKGNTGPAGRDGKSAYAYAVEGGYTGTETEFAAKLAAEKFANPNALTFTGAVTGSYDGSAPLEVAIPSGGTDCTLATNVLASGTVVQGSEEPVDTGVTLGKLKEYKMFILSVSGVSNVSLHNWYTRLGTLSLGRVNNIRAQTILYEFLNAEKTILMPIIGAQGNHSVFNNFTATDNNYGVSLNAAFPDCIYNLAGLNDNTPVITYPVKSDAVDVKWSLLGVVK